MVHGVGKQDPQYFDNLLKGVRRVVYDSSRKENDVTIRLAFTTGGGATLPQARLLPIRQSLGSFSVISVELLRGGLKASNSAMHRESGVRQDALQSGFESCLGLGLSVKTVLLEQEETTTEQDNRLHLNMVWTYEKDHYLNWELYQKGDRARFNYKLGSETKTFMTQLKPPRSGAGLMEALFFTRVIKGLSHREKAACLHTG